MRFEYACIVIFCIANQWVLGKQAQDIPNYIPFLSYDSLSSSRGTLNIGALGKHTAVLCNAWDAGKFYASKQGFPSEEACNVKTLKGNNISENEILEERQKAQLTKIKKKILSGTPNGS